MPELTEKEFMGLTAWYNDEELAFMKALAKGLPETKNEMIVFHELKARLDATMIEEDVPRGEVFDAVRARIGAESGMDQASSAARVQFWKTGAAMWLRSVRGQEVRADDLVRAIGLPHPDSPPAANNVLGAFFNGAAKHGEIEWTGRYAKSERAVGKGNMQRVWFVH